MVYGDGNGHQKILRPAPPPGTGILPLYTLIQEILSNPLETTKISLLYAARSKDELLFKVRRACTQVLICQRNNV